jgi:protein gp37
MVEWFKTCGKSFAEAFAEETDGEAWPIRNVWLGVSAENQETADERVPLLLQTPAAVRFVSAEPLLGHINFCYVPDDKTRPEYSARYSPLGDLDWIIVGGESGPSARPCDVAWVRSIVEQCKEAGTACFVKQLGARPTILGLSAKTFDRKGGDMAEWPADLRVRQFPGAPC